jgi:hypothetical protein
MGGFSSGAGSNFGLYLGGLGRWDMDSQSK